MTSVVDASLVIFTAAVQRRRYRFSSRSTSAAIGPAFSIAIFDILAHTEALTPVAPLVRFMHVSARDLDRRLSPCHRSSSFSSVHGLHYAQERR